MVVFPEPVPGQPVRVSASTYVAFRRCPASALARLDGRFPAESLSSFTGALAHRIFARHLERGPIADDDMGRACQEEIGSALNPKLGALGLKPSGLRQVIARVGELYERFRRLPTEGFRSAEVLVEYEPAAGVTLVGMLDAVFEGPGAPRLADWKTGGLGDPLDQLQFYALVWLLSRGELPSGIEAVSVASGERMEAVPSTGELQLVADRVSAMVSTIRRVWDGEATSPRCGGPWCRWCPLLSECSEGRAAVAVATGTLTPVTPPPAS